jgi:hypothetical protein
MDELRNMLEDTWLMLNSSTRNGAENAHLITDSTANFLSGVAKALRLLKTNRCCHICGTVAMLYLLR